MLELVVIVHFAFIVWVVIGGFLAIRWPWLAWLHLPAVVWGTLLEWYGWICPLTPLEIELRTKRGFAGYEGGFIENYLIPVIYPEGLTREIQVGLAIGLVVVNLIAYGFVIRGRFTNTSKRAGND
jgi:hypothetical protein